MPNSRNYDFFISAPNKYGRKSFAIVQRQGKNNKTVKLPEIEAVNKKFKDGTIGFETAFALVKELKDKLYAKFNPPVEVHNENVKLLKDYWLKRYEHKDIKAKDAAHSRLRYSIEAIGVLSLFTASQSELQAKISKHPQQRRIAAALNQMLKYIGRTDVKIPLNRKQRRKPQYLSPKELEMVLGQINHPDKNLIVLLCNAAMGTGLRLGELFALTSTSFRDQNDILYVVEQMDEDLKLDLTKTRSDRTVPILPRYKNDVLKWVNEVPLSEKKRLRTFKFAAIVRAACAKVFPNTPEKHCKFHDLRHSYAIELLRLGYGLSVIHRCLGNSLQVCQEYYTGFSFTDEGILGVVHDLRQRTDH
jgi:integrase